MSRYSTLVNILDAIRLESPSNSGFYRPENGLVDLFQARSRAYIHFFLKSNFGLLNFAEREVFITEGKFDGGIDAYYIDDEVKTIYLIQSKFRNDSKNFSRTDIQNEELWSMDLKRIITGEDKDVSGNKYNENIKKFQRILSKIKTAKYKFEVIIIANLNESQKRHIESFISGYDVNIFDSKKVYSDLLLPFVRGDFYNEKELDVVINLSNQISNVDPIQYIAKTKYGKCIIRLFFVPTEEVARSMYKFRNSILEFNPRSYLGMKTNGVNKNIEDSILRTKTNDFMLLNNGITILSTKVSFTRDTGRKKIAKATLVNPQIINGGQTSFALSDIYDRIRSGKIRKNPFVGKSVLIKAVEFSNSKNSTDLTSSVSLSTNNQSVIKPADLKANDKSQIQLQEYIFDKYELYYERKKGEFFDGINKSYIKKDSVINRVDFIRAAYASYYSDNHNLRNPKNLTERNLFSDDIFKLLSDKSKYERFMLSYFVNSNLQLFRKKYRKCLGDNWKQKLYGNALRYGDMAVTMVVTSHLYKLKWKKNDILEKIDEILSKWKNFEEYAFNKKGNKRYFDELKNINNPIGYYKGDTLIKDLKSYFK